MLLKAQGTVPGTLKMLNKCWLLCVLLVIVNISWKEGGCLMWNVNELQIATLLQL